MLIVSITGWGLDTGQMGWMWGGLRPSVELTVGTVWGRRVG